MLKAIENLKANMENIRAQNCALTENADTSDKNQRAQNCAGYNEDIAFLFIPTVYKDAHGKGQHRRACL